MPLLKLDGSVLGTTVGGRVASYADVLEPVQQAVVSIHSTMTVRRPSGFRRGGSAPPRKREGLGSGVIVSPDGFIITNNHVVDGADELSVSLTDNREFKARIIGADDKTDIAVIKIEASKLPSVTLADSDKIRVGDIVFAIGNPLGVGQTVTSGIVSAKGRTELGILDDVDGYEDFIQTDAAINMGNSGGALIDAKGRLVGINSAIISPSDGSIGIGFAIPVNLAASIMHSLVENGGQVPRGYLGVSSETLTADQADSLKLPHDTHGVKVTDVSADSPAAKAGLKPDDVIIAINEHAVASLPDLRLTIAQIAPGSMAVIKFMRLGQEKSQKVSLARLDETINDLLPGVRVVPFSTGTASIFGGRRGNGAAPPTSGLVISAVKSSSAYVDELVPGQIIMQINRADVTDLASARKLIRPGANVFSIYYRSNAADVTITVR